LHGLLLGWLVDAATMLIRNRCHQYIYKQRLLYIHDLRDACCLACGSRHAVNIRCKLPVLGHDVREIDLMFDALLDKASDCVSWKGDVCC
jgi:hypothetical protein